MESTLKDSFLPYAEALMLASMGFNDECLGYYENRIGTVKLGFIWIQEENGNVAQHIAGRINDFICKAPLYDQAEEWLWNKYKITVEPKINPQEKEDLWMMRAVDWSGGKLAKQFILKTPDVVSPIMAKKESIVRAIKYIHENGHKNMARLAIKDGEYFLESIGKGIANGESKLMNKKEEIEKKYKAGDIVEFDEYVQYQGTMGEVFWDVIVGL